MTFLAGLSAIPSEMYEAAEIDGASTFRSFWAITLPNLTGVIVVTLMLSAIFTTNAIQFPYILTNGGPGNATTTFPLLALVQGLRSYDLGIASTVTLVFFPVFAVMIHFLTRRMSATRRPDPVAVVTRRRIPPRLPVRRAASRGWRARTAAGTRWPTCCWRCSRSGRSSRSTGSSRRRSARTSICTARTWR